MGEVWGVYIIRFYVDFFPFSIPVLLFCFFFFAKVCNKKYIWIIYLYWNLVWRALAKKEKLKDGEKRARRK